MKMNQSKLWGAPRQKRNSAPVSLLALAGDEKGPHRPAGTSPTSWGSTRGSHLPQLVGGVPRRGEGGLLVPSLFAFLLAIGLATPVHAKAPLPFEITVDGQRVDGSTLPPTVNATDAAGKLDIQVKFDGLGVTPTLNVSTMPPRVSYRVGDTLQFLASTNYAAWVDHGEIRIYERGKRKASGLVQVVELKNDATAVWVLPQGTPEHMEYVLRVYDADGRYDETLPLPINVASADFATHDNGETATAPGYAEDRTAVRNIDVAGGAVTVYGRNVPADYKVTVAGEPVPVDPEGSFVVQRIFPTGSHRVAVAVSKDGEGLDFSRDVEIPETEWFYVGLADFTVGYNLKNHVEDIRPGEFDDNLYTRGHAAFYVKGKIKGRYILTAAADTGEQRLKSMFKGLDEKDPQQFLKRIDPDDYYPVYGDDSTAVEDAPTKGKFYIKLQKGPSHIMWGNFKSIITGTELLRSDRALYGAQGVYRSNTPAPDGGAATALDAYAALPGTVPQRDQFRGTGGSAYFLKHQDITPGSETVTVEVRNTLTGWIVSRSTLKYADDYDFDYVQGVTILKKPLSSSSSIGTENYLVATYEYTPAARDVDGYVAGGRAQQWLGDHVRVGVTAQKEKTGTANQVMAGADIRIQQSDGTYIEAEVARSKGPGFGSNYSADGGLTIQSNGTVGTDKAANALRAEARVDIGEQTDGKVQGEVIARIEDYQKGYSTPTVDVKDKRTIWGLEGNVEVTDKVKAAAVYSEERVGTGQRDMQVQGKIQGRLTENLTVEPFAKYTTKKLADTATTGEHGKRADAGVKLIYAWDDDNEAYVYGQGTFKRTGTMDRDNRIGVGGTTQITEKVSATAEVSEGNTGFGAKALLSYEPTADDRYYLGYELNADRDTADSWPFALVGSDVGTIVAGAKHRFNEQWSAYSEDNVDLFGKRSSITQAYGVTYTPDAVWTVNASGEFGTVYDSYSTEDIDRRAISMAIAYKDEGIDGKLKAEARADDSENDKKDMQSYLLQASLGMNMDDEWRAIATFDGVFTDATDNTRAGNYAEGSIGAAYRGTTSDKWNALFKYTYLLDEPGADQVAVDGTISSPAQRSHILSGDVSYQASNNVTLGAKYGVRVGEIRDRVAGAKWERAAVHLGVLRADFHVVKEWDAMVEGRVMWSPTTDETDFGLVAAVYRHFGENMKVGVGYNFGRFSDDLRDLSQNDHGVFMNVIGKF